MDWHEMSEDWWRCRAHEAVEETSLAERVFTARLMADAIETEFFYEMLRILGCETPGVPDSWPSTGGHESLRFDSYDCSFELKGCTDLGFQFTPEQWDKFEAAGFNRAWICYADGSERFYPGNHYKAPR